MTAQVVFSGKTEEGKKKAKAMMKTDRCKKLSCKEQPLDPERPGRIESLDVNSSPSLLLNIALALQVSIYYLFFIPLS